LITHSLTFSVVVTVAVTVIVTRSEAGIGMMVIRLPDPVSVASNAAADVALVFGARDAAAGDGVT
jgi:hypothetical protein